MVLFGRSEGFVVVLLAASALAADSARTGDWSVFKWTDEMTDKVHYQAHVDSTTTWFDSLNVERRMGLTIGCTRGDGKPYLSINPDAVVDPGGNNWVHVWFRFGKAPATKHVFYVGVMDRVLGSDRKVVTEPIFVGMKSAEEVLVSLPVHDAQARGAFRVSGFGEVFDTLEGYCAGVGDIDAANASAAMVYDARQELGLSVDSVTGWAGVMWGAPPTKDMVELKGTSGVRGFARTSTLDESMGSLSTEMVSYTFADNALVSVRVPVIDAATRQVLRAEAERLWGPPTTEEPGSGVATWRGERTDAVWTEAGHGTDSFTIVLSNHAGPDSHERQQPTPSGVMARRYLDLLDITSAPTLLEVAVSEYVTSKFAETKPLDVERVDGRAGWGPVAWGDPVPPTMIQDEVDGLDAWYKNLGTGADHVGEINLGPSRYLFWNGKLTRVELTCLGQTSRKQLLDAMILAYGTPDRRAAEPLLFTWEGKAVRVTFNAAPGVAFDAPVVVLESIALAQQRESSKADKANSAANDL